MNSVIRVRSAATGVALTGVGDLNSFFGYPAAINRTTGAYGPDVIDPVCHYDPDNNRFMVVITTLHRVGTTAVLMGRTRSTWRSPTPATRGVRGPFTTSPRRMTEPTGHPTTAARPTARRPVRVFRTTRTSAGTATACT